MHIKPITAKEYEAFGSLQENWNFLNSTQQGLRMSKTGWQTEYIGGYENGMLKAAALVALKPCLRIFKYGYIPRGFLLDWNDEKTLRDFTNALKKYLKKKNVVYLNMNPYLSLRQRDKNGDLVENGQNHYGTAQMLEQLGYCHIPVSAGYSASSDVPWMSVLDIKGKSMEQLLKEMDSQTRWSINRAAKYDLVVRSAQSEKDYEEFQKMMNHTGQRNRFDAKSVDYYKILMECYQDKADLLLCFMDTKRLQASQQKLYDEAWEQMQEINAKLEQTPNNKKFIKKKKVLQEAMDLAQNKIAEAHALQKQHGDQFLLAGSLFCMTDKELVYLYSGAYDEFLKYNAPYAIHYEEIKKAVEKGMDSYNFYGISGNFQKGEEGYPLFDFKRGFGCYVVELMGDYVLPVQPVLFNLYKKMKPALFGNL